jgi:hypothetical protein
MVRFGENREKRPTRGKVKRRKRFPGKEMAFSAGIPAFPILRVVSNLPSRRCPQILGNNVMHMKGVFQAVKFIHHRKTP